MPKLIIKPTSIHMSVADDGIVSLHTMSGSGEYELQISASEWEKLGDTAKWFSKQPGVFVKKQEEKNGPVEV